MLIVILILPSIIMTFAYSSISIEVMLKVILILPIIIITFA
jgi:hypothetical protein